MRFVIPLVVLSLGPVAAWSGTAAETKVAPAPKDAEAPKALNLDGALGGIKFGTSASAVHAAIPGSVLETSGDVTAMEGEIEGLRCARLFRFQEDKLYRMEAAFYPFQKEPGGPVVSPKFAWVEVGQKLAKRLGPPRSESCPDDSNECRREWNDGNYQLLQIWSPEVHRIEFHEIQAYEAMMELGRFLLGEVPNVPSE